MDTIPVTATRDSSRTTTSTIVEVRDQQYGVGVSARRSGMVGHGREWSGMVRHGRAW